MNDSVQSATTSGQPLRVELRVTAADVRAAADLLVERRCQAERAATKRVYTVFLWASALVIALLCAAAAFLSNSPLVSAIVVLLVIVMSGTGLLEARAAKAALRRVDQKLSPTPATLTFTADASGLCVEGRYSSFSLRWPGVDEIAAAGEYVLIVFGPLEALYLPKRDIERQLPVADFLQQLRALAPAVSPPGTPTASDRAGS